MNQIRRRVRLLYPQSPARHALAATFIVGALLGPFAVGSAAVAEPAPVDEREFEVLSLRTATSATFAQPDGTMRTILHSQPVHYRASTGWEKIDRRFVESGRRGYAWRNAAAAFTAELKPSAGEGVVRYESRGAGFLLSLEGASAAPAQKRGDDNVRYPGVLPAVDLEYELLGNGLKETLVLQDAGAPTQYRFVLAPLAGKEFSLQPTGNGGLELRDGVSATPAAVILPPVVSDSRSITVEDDRGSREVLVDNPSTPGVAAARVTALKSGGYQVTIEIDEQWLRDPKRVFPVKLEAPSTNLYRYTGKRFDPAAKAYDMGARHYFPAQARWFQQDLYADAIDNLGLSADPLHSNRYMFAGANPINFVELDGHVLIFKRDDEKKKQRRGRGSKLDLALGLADVTGASYMVPFVRGGGAVVSVVRTGSRLLGTGSAVDATYRSASQGDWKGAAFSATSLLTRGTRTGPAQKARAADDIVPKAQRDTRRTLRGKTRDDFIAKRGGKCEECGVPVVRVPNVKGQRPPGNQVAIHHKKDHAKGGQTTEENSLLLCRDCHVPKHGKKRGSKK